LRCIPADLLPRPELKINIEHQLHHRQLEDRMQWSLAVVNGTWLPVTCQ
jgi:hypothetical protein